MTDQYSDKKMKQITHDLDEKLRKPKTQHFGGLRVDPTPGRLRRLEERVRRLEQGLPYLNTEASEASLKRIEEGLKHPPGPVPTPGIEKTIEKMKTLNRNPFAEE